MNDNSPHIEMYSADYCGFCLRARALLKDKGARWHEIHVDHDAALRLAMVERSGRRTVPQIFIDGRHIGGYDELFALERSGQLDGLLGKGGASSAA